MRCCAPAGSRTPITNTSAASLASATGWHLIQESLSVAHKTGDIGPKDLERVAVDTTVQPKAVAHPTDARLMHRAITKLVGLARRNRAAPGEACRHHGRPLYPRPPVQARPAPTQVPADAAWPDHPRHP